MTRHAGAVMVKEAEGLDGYRSSMTFSSLQALKPVKLKTITNASASHAPDGSQDSETDSKSTSWNVEQRSTSGRQLLPRILAAQRLSSSGTSKAYINAPIFTPASSKRFPILAWRSSGHPVDFSLGVKRHPRVLSSVEVVLDMLFSMLKSRGDPSSSLL